MTCKPRELLPPPVTHDLKSWPEYYEPVRSGKKTFEIRKNDRGFAVGHFVLLREWEPYAVGGEYTGRWSQHQITYVAGGDVAKALGETVVFGISQSMCTERGTGLFR